MDVEEYIVGTVWAVMVEMSFFSILPHQDRTTRGSLR